MTGATERAEARLRCSPAGRRRSVGAAPAERAELDRVGGGSPTRSSARLLPFSSILPPLERMVRDVARALGKEARPRHRGSGGRGRPGRILEQMRDPLMHMLRNAVDHGIEAAELAPGPGSPRGGW